MLEDGGSFVQVDEPILNTNNNNKMFNKNTEEMFIEQKLRIENTKEKNKQKKQIKPKQKQIFNGVLSLITLNDYNFWEVSKFDYEQTELEYIPCIEGDFDTSYSLQQYPLSKSFEIRNLALRTVNEVDYDTQGIELNITVILKGGSHFWIFTRSFVNMDYNESIVFDTQSEHNSSSDVFNKYASLIRISKEEHSTRCFVHFGAFCQDNNSNQISYKTFLKRQLIDYLKKDSGIFMDNDITELNISLIDIGEEVISIKITVNGGNESNDIKGTFYIPINKRAKVMFAGIGQSVLIKKLICNALIKDANGIQFTSEKKSCNCCIIV